MYLEALTKNNKTYLRIVESYSIKEDGKTKNRKKVIKNLGTLDLYDDGKPDIIKRLKEKLKKGELQIDNLDPNEFRYRSKLYSGEDLDLDDSFMDLKKIGHLFLEPYYDFLGINELLTLTKSRMKSDLDINGITKLLTFGRVLDPKSKKATFDSKDEYISSITSSTNLQDVYKILDILNEKNDAIQKRMDTKISNSSIGRKTDMMFYDVTNYYFETMYGDEDIDIVDEETGEVLNTIIGIKKKGVSKEKKSEPIVQMGLFIDQNGLPASFKLFPGNTQDKTTLSDMIKNHINTANYGKVIIVADNGNNTQENKCLLTSQNNGYIITKSVKKSWKHFRDFALEIPKVEEDKKDNRGRKKKEDTNPISKSEYTCTYNKKGDLTFKHKSRINKIKVKDKGGNEKEILEKEIIFWSKKQYDKELNQNIKFIEYLESCKQNPSKLKDKQRKSQEFIKVVQTDPETKEIIKTTPLIVLLDEKIEKYKETMGFYSIVTSEIDLDEQEIINRYHGLSRIEDSFRILKSDLSARPVFVWTANHIRAHFLICFIALTIIRLIQYKIHLYEGNETLNVDGWTQGITAATLQKSLNSLLATKFDKNSFKVNRPNDEIIKLLNVHEADLELLKIPNMDMLIKLKQQIRKSIR